MRKTLLTVSVLITAFSGLSAGVLDLQSRIALKTLRAEEHTGLLSGRRLQQMQSRGKAALPAVKADGETMAFVSMAKGHNASDLEAAGMEVLSVRGNVAIVKLPVSEVERMAASDAVEVMQLSRTMNLHMDLGKSHTGVDVAHAGGEGLPQAYTGKGVFTAVVDQGIDPHHVNFIDNDGNNRIEFLSHTYQNRQQQLNTDFYGSEADISGALPLDQFETDTYNVFHGTHTLGILGGGYSGDVDVCEGLDGITPRVTSKANPFKGVATGSHLGVACGDLSDAGIANGVAYLLGYAVDYKKYPTVVSMSLGSNIGPHDKHSAMSEFLDEMGKDAIICVSAGNEGDMKIHLEKRFTATDKTAKSFIKPYYIVYDPEGDVSDPNNTNLRYGQIVVYSEDDTPFTLQAVLYRKSRNYRAVSRFNLSGSDDELLSYASNENYGTLTTDKNFLEHYEGYIMGGATTDPKTGRYYGAMYYELVNIGEDRGEEPLVWGFEITGKDGQRVDVYCDGQTTYIDNLGVSGFDDGSRNGSISDMAVGDNIISVGSYSTRQEWTSLDGTQSAYPGAGFTPGYITEFSSFGTLADGRNLPHVCAPGSTIISSVSNPYLQTVTDELAEQLGVQITDEMREEYYNYLCQGRATVGGKKYYWKQEPGTSMSTPLVAGSIALWLEADPTLKVDDVKDIIAKTADVDDAVRAGDPVQWGAGKFNALAGLKEVIRRASGLDGVLSDSRNDRLMVTTADGRLFNIFLGDAVALDVTLHSMGGAAVRQFHVQGDEATLDTEGIVPGVYVLSVNGHTRKLAIK